jgi:hypothetical protein
MPDQPNQFEMLYDALATKYPGLTTAPSGTAVFQFAMSPMLANWDDGTNTPLYDLARSVSTDLGGFWAPSGGIDTSYRDLIASVKPANYSDNPAYQQQQTILGALTSQQSQIAGQAQAAYQEWAAVNQGQGGVAAKTMTQWLADPLGGMSWQNKADALETQIQRTTDKITAIVGSMDSALAMAQAACDPNKMTDTMQISNGGKSTPVPAFRIGGDLAGDLARWAAYQPGTYEFQATMDQSTVITTPWKTLTTTTVHADCWGANVDTHVDTSRIITDVNYAMEVSFVGLNSYQVSRGTWYDPSYVKPSVEIAPGATVTNDTFFGVDGSLHLIPLVFLVGYRPTFKLTISTEVYKQEFEANASVDIKFISMFGWQFNFDGLASLQPVQGANNTTTVTFDSPPSSLPQLLGVVSQVEWNGHTSVAADDRSERLLEQLPQLLSDVEQMTNAVARLQPHEPGRFNGRPAPFVIQVRRYMPFGAAPFVVFREDNRQTLGAGSCPALTAQPNYISVYIPANTPFYVQNVSDTVPIEVTY